MNRDGIRQFKLFHHHGRIDGDAAFKVDDGFTTAAVDGFDMSDVAVEDAFAVFAVLCPGDIVIVLGLHDLVPLTEFVKRRAHLCLVRCRGIEASLEHFIELDDAEGATP